MEPMTVRLEVWPVAADKNGLWLVSGADALRPNLPVIADSEPHAEVELELAGARLLGDTVLIHSTSWRPDGPSVVLTYLAAVRRPGLVLESWPDAQPIGLALTDDVGRPPMHAPTDAPLPRRVDVLLHALRHARFLLDTDATTAAVLDGNWRRHLHQLTPALAGMYDQERPPT